MLTIKLCTDAVHVREFCEKQGIAFDGNTGAFLSEESGQETGFCLFTVESGVAALSRAVIST